MAIVLSADIAFPLVRAASAIPGIVAFGTTIQDYSDERAGMQRASGPGIRIAVGVPVTIPIRSSPNLTPAKNP